MMDDTGLIEKVTTEFGTLAFWTFDNPIGVALRLYHGWATNELRFLRQFAPDGGVVIDGGANIGTHTIALADAVGAQGRVFAFEASPETVKITRQNIIDNGLTQVEVVCAALGDSVGKCLIERLDPGKPQNVGTLHVAGRTNANNCTADLIGTDAITIDSLHMDKLDLLKLDIEGSEFSAIKGASETISRLRPVIFVEALDLGGSLPVFDHLVSIGYKPFFCSFMVYDQNNIAEVSDNIFGVAREASLLFIPDAAALPRAFPGVHIAALSGPDDLARLLYEMPRFGDETDHDRIVADLIADRTQLRQQLVALQSCESETSELISKTEFSKELLNIWHSVNRIIDDQKIISEEILSMKNDNLNISLENQKEEMISELDKAISSIKLDIASLKEAMIGKSEDKAYLALNIESINDRLDAFSIDFESSLHSMKDNINQISSRIDDISENLKVNHDNMVRRVDKLEQKKFFHFKFNSNKAGD